MNKIKQEASIISSNIEDNQSYESQESLNIYHTVKELLDDIIDSIVYTKEKARKINLIENKIIYFKELLFKNLTVDNDEHIKNYEFARYVTICNLLRSFATQLLSQSIDNSIRDRLKSMYYKIYKKSVYHNISFKKYISKQKQFHFRKFNVLLRLNNISFKKYISVKTVSLLDTMGKYVE